VISKLKSRLRYLRACLLRGTGLLWLAKRRAAKRGVVVLTFHRVLDDEEYFRSSSLPGILVRKGTFRQFVSWAARSFDVVDLSRGIPDWNGQDPAVRVALTFDDGWLDNFEIARHSLLRNRTPATIFACPELMDVRFPFWPERVSYFVANSAVSKLFDIFPELRVVERGKMSEWIIEYLKGLSPIHREEYITRLHKLADSIEPGVSNAEPLNRTMTWDQAKELHLSGILIGSHTLSHPILTTLGEEDVRAELAMSRREIEARLGVACTMLAYPNGSYDEATVSTAAQAGYHVAFTTRRGLWTRKTDLLRVPRVNISEQKLVSPSGRFSRAMAEYALFWNLVEG
jgi:peptidoglycan/xylan/chitin deacetylase (PgdA/CDA1 family)